MSNKNKCVLPKLCDPEVPETPEVYPEATPEFSVCAGNQMLHWDGTRMTATRREKPIPDGTYGKVTFLDGCIVGVGDCEHPTYSPPYCNPDPLPCGGEDTGAASVSETADNIIKQTPLGLFAKSYIVAGSGVSVSGAGTSNNPYKISASSTGNGGQSVIAGDSSVVVEEVDGISEISLFERGIEPGKYGQFIVNKQGIITGIDDSEEQPVVRITGEDGVEVQTLDGGQVNLSLTSSDAGNDTYTFGDKEVTLGPSGRIVAVENLPNRVGPIVGSYQAVLGRNDNVQFLYHLLHTWGEPLETDYVRSGTTHKLTVYIPSWARGSDYEVLVSTPIDYSYLTVTDAGSSITITDSLGGGSERVSYVNITIREA